MEVLVDQQKNVLYSEYENERISSLRGVTGSDKRTEKTWTQSFQL